MNDEIKEILELNGGKHNVYLPKEVKEAFTCIDYELSVCSCELPKILDYITNLQQENEYLKLSNPEMNIEHFRIINENKRKIDNLRKQNKELQQENERLKEWKEDLLRENIELENTRKEAIELIKEAGCYDEITKSFNDDIWDELPDLLNILQNGSDDNDR